MGEGENIDGGRATNDEHGKHQFRLGLGGLSLDISGVTADIDELSVGLDEVELSLSTSSDSRDGESESRSAERRPSGDRGARVGSLLGRKVGRLLGRTLENELRTVRSRRRSRGGGSAKGEDGSTSNEPSRSDDDLVEQLECVVDRDSS